MTKQANSLKTVPIFLGLVSTLLLAPAAMAQEIEEIMVTAQKRAQSASDVAITLNALSREDIETLNLTKAPDIVAVTPGVGMSGSFAGQSATFAIRGVTQQDFGFHVEPPVALYMDESYYAANNAAGVGLFDLERIEILKGPQGTLFGRNATGGLVNITSRKPTKETEGWASFGYGSYNNARFEGAIGGSLSENVQARIAGMYETRDGWVDNLHPVGEDVGGFDSYGVRLHIAAQPNDRTDILFTASYNDTDQSWGPYLTFPSVSVLGPDGVPDSVDTGLDDVFPGFVSSPRSNVDDLEINANRARDDGAFFTVGGATLKMDFDMDWGLFTSVTDYRNTEMRLALDNDAGPNDTIVSISEGEIESWSQEFRWFKEWDRGRFTAGFFYLHIDAQETLAIQELWSLGGVATDSPTRLETDSYAGFGQVEFDLNDRWTLVGGLRLTREEKDYVYRSDLYLLPDYIPLGTIRTFEDSNSDWLPTWKLQAEFRPTENTLWYFGYSRGAKAGSYNAPFAGGATPIDEEVPYDDEKLDAYEIGGKWTLADGRAQLNGSVFYYDYNDYQSFKFVNFATVTTNNDAEVFGAEAELVWSPADYTDIRVGGSYTDAEINDVIVSNAAGSAIVDRRPPFTSEWQFFGLIRHGIPVGSGMLNLQADVQYHSDFYFSVANFSSTLSDSATVFGARISWVSSDGTWEVAAWGRNLSDERYKTVGFDASDFVGWTQTGYNLPRWYGGSVTYRY